jgi:DNA helicase II / ATP-dependent DNA helicase PcrA
MNTTIAFSKKQQAIINQVQGGLLVLAPVGTGKTSVLSARVGQAIKKGIAPNRILCLTFTTRAAQEMGDRLAQSMPHVRQQLTIKTFHGLCAQMLRVEAQYIGLPADFTVYDSEDCCEILKALSDKKDPKEVSKLACAIADCKSKASQGQLSVELTLGNLFSLLDSEIQKIALKYQAALSNYHALDFADLVFYTRSMLHLVPEVAERWYNRFDLVQVDEVQDTHLGEYEIVRHLAHKSGNLALIGDLDQTIYEWRGSEPDVVLDSFRAEFHPKSYSLSLNYRATQTLLRAASAFADGFDERHTSIEPSPACEVGEKICVHNAVDEDGEAEWIAQQIIALASQSSTFRYDRLAVLARGHRRTEFVSSVLAKRGVPCVTAEKYKFFMRQEIKDVLAYLRFITNPFDTGAFKRLVQTPKREIDIQTLRTIYGEGRSCGFRLTDLAAPQPFTNDDPLGVLIEAYLRGTIVIFDVETTGVVVGDDIVEIAAVKLINGQPTENFHAYISDAGDVGDSQYIHGYSNEFLRQNGQPAQGVLTNFCQFSGDALLVGHNVGFDIKMVTAHAQKVYLQVPSWEWADTWDLASRFIQAESYSLENLANQLQLASAPNHHAMDDVITTVQLLAYLMPEIQRHESDRTAVYYKYGEAFAPLAEEIARWKALSQQVRPADLLVHILKSSGLVRYYHDHDPNKVQNLKTLVEIFRAKDDPDLHPDTALRRILEFTALAKHLDHMSEQDNQAVVITAHQSKGLEFDHVFIAGLSDGEFPGFLSVEAGSIEEEKRLFYVALTRAKKRLYISCYGENSYGPKGPSPFLESLPAALITEI